MHKQKFDDQRKKQKKMILARKEKTTDGENKHRTRNEKKNGRA